jgi:cytosine permease
VAIGTSPGAMMAGGGIGEGMRGMEVVAAILVGALLLGILAVTQGVLGQRTGRPLAALTAGPLGVEGSRRTASLVMLAMMIGWLGVNADVAGTALARLIGVAHVAGVALFTVLMLLIVTRGIGVLSWSALAAGVATTALAGYGLHLAFEDRPVTLSGGHAGDHPAGFLPAVLLLLGFGAAFALRTPDFTSDLARPRQVLWCALAGLLLPVSAFALAGATLYAVTGTWDLADVLRDLGSPVVAYLFLAIGFSGSVLTNIYSGGLSLSDAAGGIGIPVARVVVAIVGGTIAALGFADHMLDWLAAMALAAPGLAALCVIHVVRGEPVRSGWGVIGLASWGAGFACAMALHLAGSPFALLVAAAVPAAAYLLLGRPAERDFAEARLGG